MRQGHVFVYYGDGKGKTTLAVGQGVRAVGEELGVVMIQFLNFSDTKESIPLKKLEPEFRIFRFEKVRSLTCKADETARKELAGEVRNAFNFAKKIIETGECDMLILDGILDAVASNYIQDMELGEALEKRPSYMDVITTGIHSCEVVTKQADYVFRICTEKTRKQTRL